MYNKTLCLLVARRCEAEPSKQTTIEFVSAVSLDQLISYVRISLPLPAPHAVRMLTDDPWNGDPANSSGPELWTVASHSGRLACKGLMLCNPSRIGLK
jgi:hypothetical protein